jgi:hypothetical protein
MSAVDSGRDTTSADLLAEIMQQILINKAGKTADNSFTVTQIIPLGDGIDLDTASSATERGLWFEITNDAGGGTTNSYVAGKISWSLTTEYPTEWGQITDDTGYGVGVLKPAIIETTTCITWMSSSGF